MVCRRSIFCSVRLVRLLQSGAETEQLEECFNLENKLFDEILSYPAGQDWTDDQNDAVNQQISALTGLYLKVLKGEMQAAVEEHAS